MNTSAVIGSLLLLFSVLAFSPPDLEDKLVNEWELTAVEEFDKKYEPDERAGDNFKFKPDQTFEGDYEGETISGTWEVKNDKWLWLTPDDGEKFKLKIIELKNNKMILEYQDPESLVRTNLIYESK